MAKTNLIILFQGRTGSTHLISLLNKNRDVIIHGEILNKYSYKEQPKQLKYIATNECGKKVTGLKTKIRDLHRPKEILDTIHDCYHKVIVMTRRNLVKQTISDLNSHRIFQTTGDWNINKESDKPTPRIIDPKEFENSLNCRNIEHQDLILFANEIRIDSLYIDYSDLIEKEKETIESICGFIDIQYTPNMKSDFIKATPDDLSKAVLNYEDLRKRFGCGKYKEMF